MASIRRCNSLSRDRPVERAVERTNRGFAMYSARRPTAAGAGGGSTSLCTGDAAASHGLAGRRQRRVAAEVAQQEALGVVARGRGVSGRRGRRVGRALRLRGRRCCSVERRTSRTRRRRLWLRVHPNHRLVLHAVAAAQCRVSARQRGGRQSGAYVLDAVPAAVAAVRRCTWQPKEHPAQRFAVSIDAVTRSHHNGGEEEHAGGEQDGGDVGGEVFGVAVVEGRRAVGQQNSVRTVSEAHSIGPTTHRLGARWRKVEKGGGEQEAAASASMRMRMLSWQQRCLVFSRCPVSQQQLQRRVRSIRQTEMASTSLLAVTVTVDGATGRKGDVKT